MHSLPIFYSFIPQFKKFLSLSLSQIHTNILSDNIIGVKIFIYIYVSLQVSTDQSAVDLNIQYQVAGVAFSMIQLLGIIAVMSQVAWQVFFIFIPVIAACIWYQVSIQSDFIKIMSAILC